MTEPPPSLTPTEGDEMLPGRRQFGRRGAVLLIFGAIWITVGYSMTWADTTPGTVYHHFPTWVQVSLWCGPGALAFILAPTRARDWPAWTLLTIPLTVRGTSYLWAWFVWHTTDGEEGVRQGIFYALFYGLFVALVLILAGWRENEPPLGEAGGGDER